jgi:hypothetical protein
MRIKISSKTTVFTKKLFPVLWFGFLACFVAVGFSTGAFRKSALFAAGPLFMAVIGSIVMKKLVFDLMDEVYDCGDSLLVKNGGQEQSIPLADIINVSVSTNTNPPRITLKLANPGTFGSDVSFSPACPFSLNPFAKNPIAENLIQRVDQARSIRYRSAG